MLVGVVSLIHAAAAAARADEWGAIEIEGRTIEAAAKRRFSYMRDETFEGSYLDTPVFVVRGARPGTALCLTAGIHGDEINGVEVARRAYAETAPGELAGTLIVFPAVNADGFRTGSRYLSDRRDLNRAFPGSADGSVASIIANAIFRVVRRCDALVDLHTASNRRANLPQIRVDLEHPASLELARHFGVGIVVGGAGPPKSLRREAVNAGIPAIIYEAGEPLRFQEEEIARGVEGVRNVMAYLGMIDRAEREVAAGDVFARTTWVRVPLGQGGFFFPSRDLGGHVGAGDLLGRIVDPLTDTAHQIFAPGGGRIIGMAVPQVVLSGYALFHLGVVPTGPARE
jgi:hypothetical protein